MNYVNLNGENLLFPNTEIFLKVNRQKYMGEIYCNQIILELPHVPEKPQPYARVTVVNRHYVKRSFNGLPSKYDSTLTKFMPYRLDDSGKIIIPIIYDDISSILCSEPVKGKRLPDYPLSMEVEIGDYTKKWILNSNDTPIQPISLYTLSHSFINRLDEKEKVEVIITLDE